MKNICANSALCVCALMIGAVPVMAQPRAVMKVGTIVGESLVPGYGGWSDIASYGLSVQNGGWNIHGGPLPASLSDMYITKTIDSASPLLFSAVLTGQSFNDERVVDAQIHVLTGGDIQVPYVMWLFNDVVVSAYNTAYEGATPVELVALDYGEVTYTYYPVNEDGTLGAPISFTYDRRVGSLTWSGEIQNGFQFVTQFRSEGVPEPGTLMLVVLGYAAIGLRRSPRTGS